MEVHESVEFVDCFLGSIIERQFNSVYLLLGVDCERAMSKLETAYDFAPRRCTMYCDKYVCLSVC